MRLSEAITIYFAVGAVFGVSNFLRSHPGRSFMVNMVGGCAAALVWPLEAVASARIKLRAAPAASRPHEIERLDAEVARKQRGLYAALMDLQTSSSKLPTRCKQQIEVNSVRVKEHATTYIALALATAHTGVDCTRHDRELLEISGSSGDDLRLGAKCLQRKNARRLQQHKLHARRMLFGALTAIVAGANADPQPSNCAPSGQQMAASKRVLDQIVGLLILVNDTEAVAFVNALVANMPGAAAASGPALSAHKHAANQVQGDKSCTRTSIAHQYLK